MGTTVGAVGTTTGAPFSPVGTAPPEEGAVPAMLLRTLDPEEPSGPPEVGPPGPLPGPPGPCMVVRRVSSVLAGRSLVEDAEEAFAFADRDGESAGLDGESAGLDGESPNLRVSCTTSTI